MFVFIMALCLLGGASARHSTITTTYYSSTGSQSGSSSAPIVTQKEYTSSDSVAQRRAEGRGEFVVVEPKVEPNVNGKFSYSYTIPEHININGTRIEESRQFQGHDGTGRFAYEYQGPQSTKNEQSSDNGVVRGQYNYIDGAGQEQVVQYTADLPNGFRATGTNQIAPVQDTLEVIQARADHAVALQKTQERIDLLRQQNEAEAAREASKPRRIEDEEAGLYTYDNSGHYSSQYDQENDGYVAVPIPFSYKIDVPEHINEKGKSVPASSQFLSSNGDSEYTYGYQGIDSVKEEQKTADGTIRGKYNYIDENNKVQTVEYVADGPNGFIASGTNLPVPVQETPEVIQARNEHLLAVQKAQEELELVRQQQKEARIITKVVPTNTRIVTIKNW